MYWITTIIYMYMYCSGTLPVKGDFDTNLLYLNYK